jgi:dTDP-4-amino-4,6-dideoxygalactose transaminase
MSKVPWVNYKSIDFDKVQELLSTSIRMNQLTNYGPLVIRLEKFFQNKLSVSSDRCVIATVNGAAAMHALVAGINLCHDKTLCYATQSFTFPCSAQGPLENSKIIDVDADLGLDLTQVPPDVDGIIVTNLFGHVVDMNKYVKWAQENQKILLFDNATVTATDYHGKNAVNYGDGCIISLHHTKPIGYGEGGLIVVDRKYEPFIRKCLNFGFSVNQGRATWHRWGSNYKMSEVSAAFILAYLENSYDNIVKTHRELYSSFLELIKTVPEVKLFPNYSSNVPFVNTIPLLFDKPINNDHIYQVELSGITARKYYSPLESTPIAISTYQKILCLPCHCDMDLTVIQNYINVIKSL